MPPSANSRGAGHGLAVPAVSRLVCHGCGYVVPLDEIRPYRCREGEARDNVDHVLRRTFQVSTFRSWADPKAVFDDPESNPFRKFRQLLYSYDIGKLGGIGDSRYLRLVDRLDAAVAGVDGHGFRETPFETWPGLAEALALNQDDLWVKDETNNVAGSHKGRHLMGIMLWLETIRALRRPEGTSPRLAIASCGNAALAAAVVARAAARPLDVFVPPDANPAVLSQLAALEAELITCPRRKGDPFGDPCYLRFLEAWREGALPFTVQVKRNGLALEGGCTLAWEMVSTLRHRRATLDHLVVQVGGGALAAAALEGLQNALDLGLIDRLPRVHTVQTQSAYPLRRAYDRLVSRLAGRKSEAADLAADGVRALEIRDKLPREAVNEALQEAARHRADYMWAWETEPKSIAFGILDDETYDWFAVTEGMLATGGVPVVVEEDRLAEARQLAQEQTGIRVEPTGSAGLAGLMELRAAGVVRPGETTALLFTGVERSSDPPS